MCVFQNGGTPVRALTQEQIPEDVLRGLQHPLLPGAPRLPAAASTHRIPPVALLFVFFSFCNFVDGIFFFIILSSGMRCHHRFLGLGREICSCRPDTSIAASCKLRRISPTHVPFFSPHLVPAEFLTIAAYSPLGLPSLRMVSYHSNPPTPRSCETTVCRKL